VDRHAGAAHGDAAKGIDQMIVLLVEDEFLIRCSLADRLREGGCVVIEAASAECAMRRLSILRPFAFSATPSMRHGIRCGAAAPPFLPMAVRTRPAKILARCIVEMAKLGERDQGRLRDAARAHLAEANNHRGRE